MTEYLKQERAPPEIFTGERLFVRELLNLDAVPGVSVAACRVEPGVTTELHRLSVAEWYLLRAGRGVMEVGDGDPFAVEAGAVVEIPPGVAQRITNTGNGDLLFDCVCVPRFTPGCYESLEKPVG